MTKSSKYRADIQGLRAIAVLLVLLFHFETRLRGGYLGVDMFFVISGFVIASSTLREIDHTNTFSWSAFLHRRIRRLLPGIAVVVVATSVLSMLLLSPFGPQQETAKMLLSAASYTSNFVLMPQSYFSLDPKANPLLHLWSLAVEEQFYFVWPIAIILLIGIRKRLPVRMFKPLVWVAVFGVVLASCWLFLVCSVNGSEVSEFLWFKPFIQWDITPEHFAFYSPFTRAWEFVAGVLVALLLRSKFVAFVHKTGPLIVFCGVALVLFGIAWASKFPEIQHDANWSTNTSATLAVVAGTMLWIIGGIRENFIRRFISLRPFTLIGDCSYSSYLLHWPIWVLLITSFKQSNYLVGIAFAMSLILGWLQFRFVEEPIRSKSRIPSTKSLRFVGVFGVVASVGFVAMSLTTPILGLHLAGIKPDEISLHITEKSCAGERYALDSAQSCVFGSTGKQGTAILVGDSMAKSLSDGFVKAANSQEMNAYVFLLPGCAYEMSDSPFSATNDCARWRADVLSALQQLQPKVVIIANLNSLYVEQSLPNMTIEETQVTWGSELTRTLEQLSELQIPVILAQPPPRFAYDLRYDLSLLWRNTITEPRVDVLERREKMNQIEANAIVGFEFVRPIVDFTDLFCNSNICDPKVSNKYMFEDNDHLSVDGSIYVSAVLERALAEALTK
jgi:peptidoglycan/LPS O-acetylase OafA/YrhL